MKFIHLLAVIGVSAGLAVATRGPRPTLTAAGGVPDDPPWLTGAWSPEAEAEPAHVHDSDDPHAGLYDSGDPHAGVYDGDPHAGVYPSVEAAALAAPSEPVQPSRAENGRTVAGIFAERQRDAGRTLRVRGTVIKLTEGVLGKNYLHLWDGSTGAEGPADLTVTSVEVFEIGETVEVEGQLAIDQDVGAGYRYDALLADAHRVGT
jgi:hypothetical protein